MTGEEIKSTQRPFSPFSKGEIWIRLCQRSFWLMAAALEVEGVQGESNGWNQGYSTTLISSNFLEFLAVLIVIERFPLFPERSSCDIYRQTTMQRWLISTGGWAKSSAFTHTNTQTDFLEQQTFSVFKTYSCCRNTEPERRE